MSVADVFLNIGIGLGTGLVSGVIVSYRFSKKEKELDWRKNLDDEKQIMVRYLELLQFELNLIGRKLSNKETVDYDEFERIFLNEPFTKSITNSKVTDVSMKHIGGARKVINDIKSDAERNEIDQKSIKEYESRLIRAKIDILGIAPK